MPAPTLSEDEDGSFQMVKVAQAWAMNECFQAKRSTATHVATVKGPWKVEAAMHMISCLLSYDICPDIIHRDPDIINYRCMILVSYMISWSRIYNIV